MTPFEIDVLLYYHSCPGKHPRFFECPGIEEAADRFTIDGILAKRRHAHGEPIHGEYVATEKGRAFVALLCSTPYPETRFVDPRTGQIIG